MEEFTQENQNYLEDAKTTLELCKQLKSLYDAGSLEEKAGLAKIVASNYSLIDGTLYPQMRKPFDLVAKGLSSSEWLPLLDAFRHPTEGFKIELSSVRILFENAKISLAA